MERSRQAYCEVLRWQARRGGFTAKIGPEAAKPATGPFVVRSYDLICGDSLALGVVNFSNSILLSPEVTDRRTTLK